MQRTGRHRSRIWGWEDAWARTGSGEIAETSLADGVDSPTLTARNVLGGMVSGDHAAQNYFEHNVIPCTLGQKKFCVSLLFAFLKNAAYSL